MSNKSKAVILLLATGFFWLAVSLGILLYARIIVFPSKITPDKFSILKSNIQIPIQPNAKGVNSAKINYSVKATVDENVSADNNNNIITFAEYKGQNVLINKNTYVTEATAQLNQPPTIKRVSQIVPGDIIYASLLFDLKSQMWLAVPSYIKVQNNSALPSSAANK